LLVDKCRLTLDPLGQKFLFCSMAHTDSQHPRFFVRQHGLVPHDLEVVDAARILEVSRQAVSNLVTGRAGISNEMAVHLAKAFGQNEKDWLRLQFDDDLAQVRKRAHAIQVSTMSGQSTVSADSQQKLL
jgi:addiction module HigA family antidote